MTYNVDVNGEYQKSKSKLFRWSLVFSIILTLVLTGDVLLIILAKEDYFINLIIAIVITVLFSWFAIYFFFNIYGELNAQYRYFKGYESGLQSTEEVEILAKIGEICYVNGLYVYPLHVRTFDGLVARDRVIYTIDKNLDVKENDKLTITTYQRILIKAEKHS